MEQLPKIPLARPPVNTGEDKTQRRNALYYKGVQRGPSHIKRFGHFVVTDDAISRRRSAGIAR